MTCSNCNQHRDDGARVHVRQPDYILPQPWRSEDDYRRYHHLDLDGMTPAQRWAECRRAELALASVIASGDDPPLHSMEGWPLPASAYLRERIARTKGGQP